MVSEWKDRSVDRSTGCRSCGREYPHAAPAIGRLFEKDPGTTANPQVRLGQFREGRTRSFSGQRFRIGRAAKFLHWTDVALWPRSADKRAEIHKGRIENASFSFRDDGGGEPPDGVASTGRINALFVIEKSRKEAGDVCIDDRERLVERERGDGVRRIPANTRKFANCARIAR